MSRALAACSDLYVLMHHVVLFGMTAWPSLFMDTDCAETKTRKANAMSFS